MKLIFSILISLGKIYLGVKVMWWVFEEMKNPELHSFSEIEVFFVLLVFDIWITGQNLMLEKYHKEDLGS